jgi:hypothetical protein
MPESVFLSLMSIPDPKAAQPPYALPSKRITKGPGIPSPCHDTTLATRHCRLLPYDYSSLKPASRTPSIAETETAYSVDVISIATHLFTIQQAKAAWEILGCLPNYNDTVVEKMARCNHALT